MGAETRMTAAHVLRAPHLPASQENGALVSHTGVPIYSLVGWIATRALRRERSCLRARPTCQSAAARARWYNRLRRRGM